MDKEDLKVIDQVVTKAITTATTNAVAQMREFHLDDMKVLSERMDVGFDSLNRRIDGVEAEMRTGFERVDGRFNDLEIRMDRVENATVVIDQRLDRVENALAILLDEFKKRSEEVTELKKQINELTLRVQVLEQQLAATR